ncbi:MAG: hypothetical protein A4E27_00309 [Methanobacterium sp. PtaU1.Bin242]|jgi:hypothetical protein|nr:MAG: hypothetical protein A4E27_00309 [Methanobacterium sp. PtaU1.Bin242]
MTEKDIKTLRRILERAVSYIRVDSSTAFDYVGVIAWVEMKIDEYQRQAVKEFLKPNSGVLLGDIRPTLYGEVKNADDKVLKSIKH